MSKKEIDRNFTQVQASHKLHLSYRHTKTLVKRFREHGAAGIASKRRDKPSNNHISEALRQQTLHLVNLSRNTNACFFSIERARE